MSITHNAVCTLRVAVLGETSGKVRDAFRRRGHDATSYDLLPSDVPGPHIQGDYVDADLSGLDIIIAHPTCTYLCNSGVRWLHTEPGRWAKMEAAARHFRWVLYLPARIGVAVENPLMHKHAAAIVGRRQNQVIQPWHFGHGETKATGLWLRGLPRLVPTNIVAGREARVHRMPPGPDRWKKRSETYAGIAEAMAEQWSRVGDTFAASEGAASAGGKAMNIDTCRHFNGICGPGMKPDHVQCTVGQSLKDYVEHDGRMNKWPCISGNSTAKKCPRFDPFTAEEVAKDKAEMDAYIKGVMEAHRRIPKHGALGVVECPVCKGNLRWSRAVGYNNHVHARCETPDCLSWME